MNQSPETDWHRLVRYVSGEFASEGEADLRAWIVEDERRARLMDDLKEIWEASGTAVASRDVEAAWREVSDKINVDASKGGHDGFARTIDVERCSEESGGTSRAANYRRRKRSSSGWRMLIGGAVVGGLVVAVLLTVIFHQQSAVTSPDKDRVFTTKPGQRATVQLSDGTEVRLNVDSRLSLPKEFSSEKRAVELEGEAFFDVASDSTRPFVVRMSGATIEVLGTAFGVRAYADDKERQVAVSEGRVAIHTDASGESEPVLLESKNLGVIAGQHVQAVRQNVDLREQLAWTKGQLIFKDAPFDEVVRKLERWHDIRIKMQVNSEEVDRLNATFDNESVEKTLTAIAAALDLRYQKDGRNVLFFRPERAPTDTQ